VGFCLSHMPYWYNFCWNMNAVEISYSVALLAVYTLTDKGYTITILILILIIDNIN
jgi:hypothetical protein